MHAPASLAAVCKQGIGYNGSARAYLCSMMGVEPMQQLCLLAIALFEPKHSSLCLSCGTVKPCGNNTCVSLLQSDLVVYVVS